MRILLPLLALFSSAHPQLTGKIVAIADGDTFTMLVEGEQVEIRHEVDCRERGQDFSSVAQNCLGDLVSES